MKVAKQANKLKWEQMDQARCWGSVNFRIEELVENIYLLNLQHFGSSHFSNRKFLLLLAQAVNNNIVNT